MDPLIILFGLGVGILVGTTGMGGGSIMTPLLILVFGVKPVVAIGTDLAYAAVTKTVGGWRHWRQGTVDLPISSWLAVGSIPGALGGVWLLHRIQEAAGANFDSIVLSMVAGALLITAAAVLARATFLPRHIERERETVALTPRMKAGTIAFGFAVGIVLGTTSAGSGALIAVGLIMAFRLTPQRVVGTDVFHAALLLWVAAFAYVVAGKVDFGLAGNILIGSVPGVWIGSSLSTRLPERGLRPALGIVLLAAALGLLTKAGLAIPPLAIVGVPAAAAVAVWAIDRRREPAPADGAAAPRPEPAPAAELP